MSIILSSLSPTSSHILAPYTLPPPYSPLSLLPPATSWLLTHCLRHTVLCLSYLHSHPGSLHTSSAIQSSVFPTSNHILAPYTLPPPYSPLSYLQPHPGSLHTASAIQSSVSPTSSHILAPYTLPPPYSPLSLLPPATSWLLTHCLRHTVLCLSYLHFHPGSLHTSSAIQSSVSPTSSHILAPYTLPPPYSPLSLSYLQPHPGSLHTASAIQSSVSPTSIPILAPYTLPPPYSPLSLLPPATSWLLTHCLLHTVLCLSYLHSHPGSLHISSAKQSSVSPTSNAIMAPYTLPRPYSPPSLLPPGTSWLLTHCLRHTVLCLSYLQPHPG